MNISSSLFLKAIKGENHPVSGSWRPPVWLMRQAGRYMPEYRALRQKASFMEMCQNPDLICEVTLQPINYLGVDAAILFSDILIVAKCFGLDLRFEEGIGPVFSNPLTPGSTFQPIPPKEALGFVAKGISLLKQELKVPLVGFCGAPFTVASYFIEGKSSPNLFKTRKWVYESPETFKRLIDTLTKVSIDYLKMQVEAGVDAVQIFDTWASFLSPELLEKYSLNPLKQMTQAIESLGVPVILFGKGGEGVASKLGEAGSTALSADWTASLPKLREILGPKKVLQGNFDPALLLTDKKTLLSSLSTHLKSMQGDPAYIFNLGHGIDKTTPPENVLALVKGIQEGKELCASEF